MLLLPIANVVRRTRMCVRSQLRKANVFRRTGRGSRIHSRGAHTHMPTRKFMFLNVSTWDEVRHSSSWNWILTLKKSWVSKKLKINNLLLSWHRDNSLKLSWIRLHSLWSLWSSYLWWERGTRWERSTYLL